MWIMRDDGASPETTGTTGSDMEVSEEYTVVVYTNYFGRIRTYFSTGFFVKWKNKPISCWTNDAIFGPLYGTRVIAWLDHD